MSTRAVTPDASAASAIEEALESGFLPDDEHYRRTGEFKLPEEEKKPVVDPNTTQHQESPLREEDASAASDNADTAAASAAAETQEKDAKGPAESKTGKTSESRWAKVTRENKELRERLEKLERGPQRETKQEPQPAAETKGKARPEPKIDEVDAKTGKAKYATYEDYMRDLRAWDRELTLKEFQDTSAKTARESEQQRIQQTISTEWGKRTETATAKYADFNEVALNPDLPIKQGSVVDVFILDSPHGTDVLYHLGQNPAELERINKLNPIGQARELTKIELKFSATEEKKSTPARPITQAPRPPHQVSGKGTVAKDAVEQAVEDQDQETYNREANARELARHKRK